MPKVSRNKRTITRDSVFRHTGTQDTAPQGIKPEAAPTHQTAVWLGDEEVEWLDSRCREIRKSGWRSITRSAFIRAIIRAAMGQQTDGVGVSGESELTQRLSTRK
jgi:hypothetical protein